MKITGSKSFLRSPKNSLKTHTHSHTEGKLHSLMVDKEKRERGTAASLESWWTVPHLGFVLGLTQLISWYRGLHSSTNPSSEQDLVLQRQYSLVPKGHESQQWQFKVIRTKGEPGTSTMGLTGAGAWRRCTTKALKAKIRTGRPICEQTAKFSAAGA